MRASHTGIGHGRTPRIRSVNEPTAPVTDPSAGAGHEIVDNRLGEGPPAWPRRDSANFPETMTLRVQERSTARVQERSGWPLEADTA